MENNLYSNLVNFYNVNDENFKEFMAELYKKMLITHRDVQYVKEHLSEEIEKKLEIYLVDGKFNINIEEKVNEFLENNQEIKDITAKLIINTNKIEDNTSQIKKNTTELEKVKTEYYLTHNTTLKEIVEGMGVDGGCIYVSDGVHEVNESFVLDKKIVIKGHGINCKLKLNALIISDDSPLHSLEIENLEIISGNNKGGIYFNKAITATIYEGSPTLNNDLILNKVRFYNEQVDGGTFLKIKQSCNSNIVNCDFQNKYINSSNYNGIEIISEGKLGIRNLFIQNCKFSGLNYAIKCIGDKTWYTHTCGLMINNTLIMDSNYGVYGENLDWVTFSNGMIDYTDFPIKTLNVSNLKVKNNYIFSRRREISSSCVEYVVEDTKSKICPEICGNHMWNSSYGNLESGVTTTAIMIKCRAVNEDSELINGILSNNTIHRVNHGINISTEKTDNLTSKIKYFSIHDNNFYMCNRGIYSKGVVENTIAPNNLFNTVVKAIESESNIPLSNILTKTIQINLKGTRYNQVSTGIPHQHIISANLIYDDNVFTFKACAYLKHDSDIIGVMTVDQTPSDKDYIFTVEVKYTPSW